MKFNIENAKKLFDQKWILNESTGCHEWTGYKNKKGYGRVTINKKTQGAHRAAWAFGHGVITEGMHVLHQCDNPSCVNPEHLSLGTTQQNTQDMLSKGRSAKGESHSQSKLTEDQVVEIRSRRADGGSLVELSDMFNVSISTISVIANHQKWTHVQPV